MYNPPIQWEEITPANFSMTYEQRKEFTRCMGMGYLVKKGQEDELTTKLGVRPLSADEKYMMGYGLMAFRKMWIGNSFRIEPFTYE
jgi:hypothetical protein